MERIRRVLLQQYRVATDTWRRVFVRHQAANIVTERKVSAPIRAGQRSCVKANNSDLIAFAADHPLPISGTQRQFGRPSRRMLLVPGTLGERLTDRALEVR